MLSKVSQTSQRIGLQRSCLFDLQAQGPPIREEQVATVTPREWEADPVILRNSRVTCWQEPSQGFIPSLSRSIHFGETIR